MDLGSSCQSWDAEKGACRGKDRPAWPGAQTWKVLRVLRLVEVSCEEGGLSVTHPKRTFSLASLLTKRAIQTGLLRQETLAFVEVTSTFSRGVPSFFEAVSSFQISCGFAALLTHTD